MRNALFGFFCSLAVCGSIMIGESAFASPGMSSTKIASHLSFKLPRYEQWKSLSPEAQRQVIEGVQAFLIQADEEARKSGDQSALNDLTTLKTLYHLWIESAEAKSKEQQPYCINQGVVKPLSECDTSQGYKMHDFDTNAVLSKLGPASRCPTGQMPCSPFFGFTSDGQMFCSSKNLTRDCAQQSKQPGTVSVVNVMMSCQAGSPGVAKVDCKALGEFLDQQMGVVEKLCQKAPKRFACGILKDQMHEVVTEASEKKTASEKVGLDKIAEVVNATNEAAKMSASTAPCPTAAPQASPAEKPASPPQVQSKESKTACTKKTMTKLPAQPTLGALMTELAGNNPDDFICGELTLPNQGKFGMNRMTSSVTIQATPDSKPVVLDLIEAQVFGVVSETLLKDPYKVSPKELLSHYLPKEVMTSPGKITIEAKDGKQKKEFPSKGWVTSDGTRIRYIPNTNFGNDEKPRMLAAIKSPGDTKEHILVVNFGLPGSQEADPNDSKALPNQPK